MPEDDRALDLDDKPALQARMWRAQRIGWVVLAIWIVLAASGCLGNGPVANQATAVDGNRLVYQRIVRLGGFATVQLAPASQPITLMLGDSFFRSFSLCGLAEDGVLSEPANGAVRIRQAENAGLAVRFAPRRAGWINSAIQINGRPVTFTILVLP